MLGARFHFWLHEHRARKLVPLRRDQRAAQPVREESDQEHESLYRLRHYVRGRLVPQLPDQPLGLPEDGHEQAARVHARESPGSLGHGKRDVLEDCQANEADVCQGERSGHGAIYQDDHLQLDHQFARLADTSVVAGVRERRLDDKRGVEPKPVRRLREHTSVVLAPGLPDAASQR